MHDTGIVRRVDDLGRIVIPMELRRSLGIKVKDPLEIFVEGERIILARPKESCVVCGESNSRMVTVKGRLICPECIGVIRKG